MEDLQQTPNAEIVNDPLNKNKRKKLAIISIIVIFFVIASLMVFFFALKPQLDLNKKLELSNENYKAAKEYELDYDYSRAIEYYERVVEEDAANYKNAQIKIEKLKKESDDNKFIAKSLVALKNQNIISAVDDVSQIGFGNVSDYGLTMTCRINGYGYVVSESQIDSSINDAGLGTYVSIYYNRLTSLYIMEYKVTFFDNGWLSHSTNQLRQEGSDAEFQLIELFTKKEIVVIDLVKFYFNLYFSNLDMAVFD